MSLFTREKKPEITVASGLFIPLEDSVKTPPSKAVTAPSTTSTSLRGTLAVVAVCVGVFTAGAVVTEDRLAQSAAPIMVLQSVGLNPAWVAIIFPVDRILDMCRTVVNITGDATVSTIVSKFQKTQS